MVLTCHTSPYVITIRPKAIIYRDQAHAHGGIGKV
jgi:hypothetical protein